jgi:hypothetical protein
MQKLVPMLCVTDAAQSVASYESLGFSLAQRHPESGDIDFAFLKRDGVELMIQPRGSRPANQVALWFYTDRLDEMYAVVRRQHPPLEFLEELYEPFYGGRQFSVADVNGVELVFYDPGAG